MDHNKHNRGSESGVFARACPDFVHRWLVQFVNWTEAKLDFHRLRWDKGSGTVIPVSSKNGDDGSLRIHTEFQEVQWQALSLVDGHGGNSFIGHRTAAASSWRKGVRFFASRTWSLLQDLQSL